jgi:hypothetical protein
MTATFPIHELLRESQVPCAAIADGAVLTRDRAVVVVCVADGRPIPALVPDSLGVHLERLMSLAGVDEIRFAGEDEGFARPGPGPLFVDIRLALADEIVFATDTAEETIVVRWADLARAARPIVGDFAVPSRDRVGAYRLSSCE